MNCSHGAGDVDKWLAEQTPTTESNNSNQRAQDSQKKRGPPQLFALLLSLMIGQPSKQGVSQNFLVTVDLTDWCGPYVCATQKFKSCLSS